MFAAVRSSCITRIVRAVSLTHAAENRATVRCRSSRIFAGAASGTSSDSGKGIDRDGRGGTPSMRNAIRAQYLAAMTLLIASTSSAQSPAEWPVYGRDAGATKYSPLADINRTNVAQLTLAWEWATGETPRTNPNTRPGNFQATPLMIGDTLFLSTPYNRVVALDAPSGRELWSYDPHAYDAGQPSNGTG